MLKLEVVLTKEKIQEILEEVFSDYVRVEEADAQKVYEGLMEMFSEHAVEQPLAPDEATTCPNCGDDLFRCPSCQEAHLQRLAGKA